MGSWPHPQSLQAISEAPRWAVSHMCVRTPSTPASPPGASSLNPMPSVRVFWPGQWRPSDRSYAVVCGGQWAAGGCPTHTLWHVVLWAPQQFCWLRLPEVCLNRMIRPGQAPRSPRLLFHSPRILCLLPRTSTRTTRPLHMMHTKERRGSQPRNSQTTF